VNLLLTCSTTPDFDRDGLDLWNNFCIADWMPGDEVIQYLLFSPSSEFASIDAIVFLEPNSSVGFFRRPDGSINFPDMTIWEGHWHNALLSKRIRNLPEACAMRDGRKWKSIPQIVLTKHGHRNEAYDGLEVEFVLDFTERMLLQGFSSPFTWNRIEQIVNQYHRRAMTEYERVGFLVTVDRGLYRVRRAFRKRNSDESEFYFGGKDKRRFHNFVTIGRDHDGADYQALLFEQLLNDPKAGEREFHRFFEEHPDFLAEAMMGVPISHKPHFSSNKQTPDFSVSPSLPRDSRDPVKLLELKGPEASVLASKQYLHRGLAPALVRALAQVNDYEESLRDPLNLRDVVKALGYVPTSAQRAVLIGRTPLPEDANLWEKRKAEQPSARIITYDEVLQENRNRLHRRRRR
jgi:hypothetical protein